MKFHAPTLARLFALTAVQLFLLATLAPLASANHTEGSPVRIDAMDIQVAIDHHYAVTTVAETVTNPDTAAHEFAATIAAPELSFVTRFALEVGGSTYESNIEDAAAARAAYDAGVAASQAGAIIESRDTHTYRVALNVPALTTVVVHLAYEELVYRTAGAYHYRFPLIASTAGQSVGILTLGGFVTGSAAIDTASASLGTLERPSPTRIAFSHRTSHLVQDVDFALVWTEGAPSGAGAFISHATASGGTFLHTFSADGAGLASAPLPKDIVFVIDVSGSMTESLPQVKEVFSAILGDLRSTDRFSVVAFSATTQTYPGSLSFATPEYVAAARSWVEGLRPRSATDIDAGLTEGMGLLSSNPGRAAALVLLSDGEPTDGVTDPGQIRSNLRSHNLASASVYTLAFGGHADFDLLQALALENGGVVRRIWLGTDAGAQIRGFYDSIATPLLTGVTIEYSGGAEGASPTSFPRAFAGSDLTAAGTIAPGAAQVTVTVSADSAGGPVTFTDTFNVETAEAGAFVERAWAYERIRTLSGSAALGDASARAEITSLALKYRFVTDYTSLVVVLPAVLDPTNTARSMPMLVSSSTAAGPAPSPSGNTYSAAPSPDRAAPGPGALLAALGLVGVALAARAARGKRA